MQTYREGEYPGKSEVTVLPIIDLNPTDSICIYSTLLFVIEQAQKANIGTATITFDQPLWLKAVKISSEKSLNILCRLGGFHTLMSFLGSVGTSMEGSGISECLQMVYGENAVVHILSGKAVSRALRAHFLLQSSLMLKIIASIIQEQHVSEEDLAGINTLYDSFVNGKSSDEELTKSKVLEKVHGAIGNKMNHLSTTSRTAKLWIQYISYIDVIKQFICGDCHGVDCENGTREIDEESIEFIKMSIIYAIFPQNGQTVLTMAAELGKLEIVKELINHGADVNAEDNDNWTALLIAAKEGHNKVVSLLLERGAEIEHKDMNGWTALLWVSYKGHLSTAKILLHYFANVNAHGQYNLSSLAWASGRNRLSLVQELLAYGAKVNQADKYGTTPLVWACRKGSLEVVNELLKAGANVDCCWNGLLFIFAIIGLILNYSWTPLLVATTGNFSDVVLLLLDHKPNVNATDKDGCTALTIACKHGNNVIVKALLSCGAYVNLCDRNGDTNLIHAVKAGHVEVVSSLIGKYADVDVQGADKKTALYWSAEKCHVTISKILLSANPDIDSPNIDSDTPLMRSARSRSKELVQLLLDKNAKVQMVDKKGDTALHIAMRSRSKGIVEILLRNPKHSKLLYKTNKNEETPYSIDTSHTKCILTQLFGARRLNTNEDNENLLGYDLYSSCLADILSEPTLSMPISVGLYAKWGSGKSFLLEKLQDEMKTFSAQNVHQVFSLSWIVLLLNSQISLLFGILMGLVLNFSLIVGVLSGFSMLAFIFICLGIVWFGSNRYDWSWCYDLSNALASKMNYYKLLFEIIFCHPPNQRREWQMQSIKFLFTNQTKGSFANSQMSVSQIVRSLYEAVEMEWGNVIPRLYTVFRPKTVNSEKRTFRRTCLIPTVLVAMIIYVFAISGIIVLSLDFNSYKEPFKEVLIERNGTLVSLPMEPLHFQFDTAPAVFVIIVLVMLALLLLVNITTIFNIASALIFPNHSKRNFKNCASEIEKQKSDVYLQEMKKEVFQISGMVKCFEGFTGRRARIVIVVDGLDSCEQDKVLNMLDTVRILFSDQNSPFVTLLAIDPHVIIRAIESNISRVMNDTTINGHDYLHNIIHLPFYLQNSGLRGIDLARVTAQTHHKTNLPNAEETYKSSHRGSTVSNISFSDAVKNKALTLRIRDSLSGGNLGLNAYSRKIHGAHDLTKVLLNDDYFSDVNPRSMRRLMNVLYITGRLMKAFSIDFNWYHMASWVNITEQWPYRTSWIIYYYEKNENQLEDDVSLKFIYEKVHSQIPISKEMEPMLELDRDGRKFEIFLKYHTSSLQVADLKIFHPFTINLDPYILKIIKENLRNFEESRKLEALPVLSHLNSIAESPIPYTSGPRNRKFNDSVNGKFPSSPQSIQNPYMFYGPNHPLFTHKTVLPPTTVQQIPYCQKVVKKFLKIPENFKLEAMTAEDVGKLLDSVKGILKPNLAVYKKNLIDNNVSGLVLLTCDLDELKKVVGMSFGDWELFRQMVLHLKESVSLSPTDNSHEESVSSEESSHEEEQQNTSQISQIHYIKNISSKSFNEKKSNVSSKQENFENSKDVDDFDGVKGGDHLTKQVTFEESMIFGALQCFNEEAKEHAMEVQAELNEKRQASLTLLNKDDAHPETEVLYFTSPPASPKFREKSFSVSLSKLQNGDGKYLEEINTNSPLVTNISSSHCKCYPSNPNINNPSEYFSQSRAPTGVKDKIHSTHFDTRPHKLALSASSSMERIHFLKKKLKSAISPNSYSPSFMVPDKSYQRAISPLVMPSKKDTDLITKSELTPLAHQESLPQNNKEFSEGILLTNANPGLQSEELTKYVRYPFVRQDSFESVSSYRFKNIEDYEDESEESCDVEGHIMDNLSAYSASDSLKINIDFPKGQDIDKKVEFDLGDIV
ncbi:Kinase D-interacting substrate [Nymphon striatum]|nr:Kinase D-interacting substrate [Nymphon striatum]